METLTKVYCDLQSENILLFDHEIESHIATTLNIKNDYAIFIDYKKLQTLDKEFLAVVHEMGHCMSGTTHKVISPFDLVEKHDYLANKYSVHKYLPLETLNNAIKNGYTEYWELSEYFDLPENFIKLSVNIYKQEGFDLFQL